MEGWKYASVYIPLTQKQYDNAQQILTVYISKTPYDYAFIGMRCASSTREILGQLGIMEKKSNFYYVLTTFYPKRLRKKVLKLAKERQYKVIKQDGKTTRKWEKD